MRVYFDSSAFAKRYIDEAGTDQVLMWCEQASELALSIIAVPELISAFCRLQREDRLTDAQYQIIKNAFMLDIADALICDTTPQVIQHAVKALERHTLRGMDAIHLGAALACTAEMFISADVRQCRAAEAFGLQVVAL
ncbi:MAG: type II toxin-antitoxin system VapC family toxin [Acidiferrobacter sp.]